MKLHPNQLIREKPKSSIGKSKQIYRITYGGMLTALTVVFQSTPIFLSTIGLLLSPFSTLPIAFATTSSLVLGVSVYLSTIVILTFISLQESLIFLFSTGLLGLSIGLFLYRKGIIRTILYSSLALTVGILLLTFVVGIPGIKAFSNTFPFPLLLVVYFIFSMVYSGIWCVILLSIFKRINLGLIDHNHPLEK